MNWEDVSIDKFAKVQDVNEMDCSEIEKSIRIIAIINDIDYDQACKLNVNGRIWTSYKKNVRFLEKFPPLKPVANPQKIKIKDKEYSLCMDATALTAGQYIDIQNFLKDNKVFDNLHLVLASLTGEDDVLGISKIFRHHFPMSEAYPIAVFFWEVYNALTENTQISLMDKLSKTDQEVRREFKELLANGGDGLSPWTISQIQTYLEKNTSLTNP